MSANQMTAAALPEPDWREGGFGVYLHWPFCQSKCPYCDFNSHVASSIDWGDWEAAFLSEIDRYGKETAGRVLQTIYVGGGTPSLMRPKLLATLIDRIRSTWRTVNNLEITLEANPGSVEAGRFRDFHDAGVNRVSIGVQALNDVDLRKLGRMHSSDDALRAIDIARQTFDRFSFDLIYARQHQTLLEWERELSKALQIAGDHLSLYQLTIEDGTVFSDRARLGKLQGLPPEEVAAEMYELTQEMCSDAGLPSYEVSNHARPGSESRHNLIYWRGGDYIGIGPGAHGRLTLSDQRVATEAFRQPTDWLGAVKKKSSGEMVRSGLAAEDQSLEYLMMALRTNEGLDLQRYEAMSGKPINPQALRQMLDLEMVSLADGRLKTTKSGRLVLNAVIREFAT